MSQRQTAPATARNREPILDVLKGWLPNRPDALILEIAAGTGEHAVYFAPHFPKSTWQPTDMDTAARASITAWAAETGVENVFSPLSLDVRDAKWPIDKAEAVVCINMIHISPWACTEGLMAGAARTLSDDGVLITYGPYKRDGRHTAPTNDAFDLNLRSRNLEWGIRDMEKVTAEAEKNGLQCRDIVTMPANNFCLVFEKD